MSALQFPYEPPLVAAEFVGRPHRFAVEVRLRDGDRMVEAHLPDPGRLLDILVEGATLWLQPSSDPRRATMFSVRLAELERGYVGLDTQLPNALVKRALMEGAFPEFEGRTLERAEYRQGDSRFDFLLRRADGLPELLEVKSVTMCVNGVGRFPDAVSARATRHLNELSEWSRAGNAATVLFVVQRPDVNFVEAAREIDPSFADALEAAIHAKVRILARRCDPSPEGHRWGPAIAVRED